MLRTRAVLLHLVSWTLGTGDTFAYLCPHNVTSKYSWKKTSQRSVMSPNTATSVVTSPSSVVFPVTHREGTQGEEEDEEAIPAASGHVTGWPHTAWAGRRRMAVLRADWMLWPIEDTTAAVLTGPLVSFLDHRPSYLCALLSSRSSSESTAHLSLSQGKSHGNER